MKDGDAKPWIYGLTRWDYDSQVAEDEIHFNILREPGKSPGSFFLEPYHIRSIKANPLKDGDAKPWIYGLTRWDYDSQVAENALNVRWVRLGTFIEKENPMTLKTQSSRTALNASLLVVFFFSVFSRPNSAFALGSSASPLPSFADFSASAQNGDASALRGVYVPDVMALPIVQQPAGNAAYVSTDDGTATQFKMASQYGNIGLLAHNYLSGKLFPQLTVGQEVRLVYGNGKVEYFVISEVLQYQALQPTSPYSSFHNLNKDETLTAEQMFKRVYFGDRHVTFQTCIAKDGNSSWGRLFVIATPKPQVTSVDR